jgi:hypothetical protein
MGKNYMKIIIKTGATLVNPYREAKDWPGIFYSISKMG